MIRGEPLRYRLTWLLRLAVAMALASAGGIHSGFGAEATGEHAYVPSTGWMPQAEASVIITGEPADVTVFVNSLATFTVGASGNGGALSYQWFRNGEIIPNANSSSLTVGPLTVSDSDSRFKAVVSVAGTNATSREALLTVLLPSPLRVTKASGSSNLRDVVITFDQVVEAGSATDLFNYTSPDLGSAENAMLNSSGASVTVRFANAQTPGGSYTVNVQNVVSAAVAAMNPLSVDVTFKAFVLKPGFLRLSIFDGWGIPDVGVPERELPPPTETFLMPGFDTRTVLPTDSRENYLGRIDGFFIPPTSGNWIFYLRSDDSSQFWMDLRDGYGWVKLQEEPDRCGTFADHPTAPMALIAGVAYPMIGLYRERSGADYMQVAAKLESDPTPPDLLQPISGNMLGIYAEDANRPPTAQIDTDALVDFSPDFEHPVLISCNWWNACLILDGSLSSDPDGDALTHLWFVEPSPVPFAAGPVATNCLEVGTHTIVLTVTDPDGASASASPTIEVVTAPLAIELLMEKVNESLVSRATKLELLVVLRTALNQSKAERIRPTQVTLDAFEKKVRAKVATTHPEDAAAWIRWSQAISSGMEKCIKAKPKAKMVGYDPKA